MDSSLKTLTSGVIAGLPVFITNPSKSGRAGARARESWTLVPACGDVTIEHTQPETDAPR
jgi:hypothetical protein